MQYQVMENQLELPYQQLLNNMETLYKSSLLKNKPKAPTAAALPLYKRDIATAPYIDSKRRERSVTASHQQGRVLSDCIQRSTSQLLVARNGHLLKPVDYSSRLCQSAPPWTALSHTKTRPLHDLHISSTPAH